MLKDEFNLYRDTVRKLSNENFQKFYYDINPNNLPRGENYHLDHKFSILDGFLSKVPPEEIANPSNLQIITSSENRIKGSKSCTSKIFNQKQYNEIINKRTEKKSKKYKIYDIELKKK